MNDRVDAMKERLKEKFAPYTAKIRHYTDLAKDAAGDVVGQAAVKVVGSEVGRAVIDTQVTNFLKDPEMRKDAANFAAKEMVAVGQEVRKGAEPFLKESASKMGVTEVPAWRQIYDIIAKPTDFFLLKPVKGLFAILLSGAMNAASFVTALAANKILKPDDANKITQGTVKSVFTGLFKQAFGAFAGGFGLFRKPEPVRTGE